MELFDFESEQKLQEAPEILHDMEKEDPYNEVLLSVLLNF